MNSVSNTKNTSLFKELASKKLFFPIIGCVLNGTQDGWVYKSSRLEEEYFLVIHKFGFAQIVSLDNVINEEKILETIMDWMSDDQFPIKKIRIYNLSDDNNFKLKNIFGNRYLSGKRIRFSLPQSTSFDSIIMNDLQIRSVKRADLELIDHDFHVESGSRFWNSYDEFLDLGKAKILLKVGNLASFCYSAATCENQVEVDVITHEKYRKQGLARLVTESFLDSCLSQGIKPLWDCYKDNLGSVALAETLGFKEIEEYNFTIISKQ